MRVQEILPVALSVVIIIVIAVVERHSKTIAAITATMPLGIPLALWIVYAANEGDRSIMFEFSRGLLVGIVPTLGFVVGVWLSARLGLRLLPMLAVGYGIWAIGVGLIGLLRHLGVL